jgi:hypothetical protein
MLNKFDMNMNEKDFSQLMKNSSKVEVSQVSITSTVLLNILNACFDKIPYTVAGQLLGISIEKTLEITSSFPIIQIEEDRGN